MLLFGQNTLKVKEYLRAAALYYPTGTRSTPHD